jgi:membrane protein
MRALRRLLTATVCGWSAHGIPHLGAALAYYTTFSLAPILVIAIGVAGLVFGDAAARGQIVGQITDMLGEKGAQAIESMVAQAGARRGTGVVATVLAVGTLLFGASGVFGELQTSLNTIWGVEPKPGRGIVGLIKDRFLSLSMVAGIAFILLVSLVVSAALSALGALGGGLIPEAALHMVNFAVSLAVVSALFAAMFKVLPDARTGWRDVWVGGIFTATLFTIGKFAIGLYLGKSDIASAYGAAGSLVVVLVWVYYSAQIVLLGAEFTKAYAEQYGTGVAPAEDAQPAVRPPFSGARGQARLGRVGER